MAISVNKLTKSFPVAEFQEIRDSDQFGGALITKVNLEPAEAFEFLEVIYGPYNDRTSKFLFIDDKTSWERLFKTKEGVLRIYDFKGSLSIGYNVSCSEALVKDADKFKQLLESYWPKYIQAKRHNLRREIRLNPLANFMRTFFATEDLLNKAYSNQSLLEAVVLYASIIDAQLRYVIILSRQIVNRDSEFDPNLVYQKGKKYFPERYIHQMAMDEKCISKSLYQKISRLYELRNRAVHRYFITNFEYSELPTLLHKFEQVKKRLGKIILATERRQIRLKVGMLDDSQMNLDDSLKKRILIERKLKIDSSRPTAVVPKRKYIFPREYNLPDDTEEFDFK